MGSNLDMWYRCSQEYSSWLNKQVRSSLETLELKIWIWESWVCGDFWSWGSGWDYPERVCKVRSVVSLGHNCEDHHHHSSCLGKRYPERRLEKQNIPKKEENHNGLVNGRWFGGRMVSPVECSWKIKWIMSEAFMALSSGGLCPGDGGRGSWIAVSWGMSGRCGDAAGQQV